MEYHRKVPEVLYASAQSGVQMKNLAKGSIMSQEAMTVALLLSSKIIARCLKSFFCSAGIGSAIADIVKCIKP